MRSRAAVVKGRFLVPGVSKNKRLYTSENIGNAVARMQEQLTSPAGLPITMATSHAAAYNDDALSMVGRVTNVYQDVDGSACFEGEIANTTAGRDVVTLINGDSPFLKSISIRGEWLADLKQVEHEGQRVATANDLLIRGIDFTSRPGLDGAGLTHVELTESAPLDSLIVNESTDDFQLVTEDEPQDVNADAAESAVSDESAASQEGTVEEETDDNNMDGTIAIQDQNMFCPSCNGALPDAVNYCPSCGVPITSESVPVDSKLTEEGLVPTEEISTEEVIEEAATEATEEVVEDATPEAPARSLTDADLTALAMLTAEAVSTAMVAALAANQIKEEAEAPAEAPVEEPAAAVEPEAEAEVEVEADPTAQESEDMADTYSADDLKRAVAEALDTFKTEVTDAYRAEGAPRKGFVTPAVTESEIDEAFAPENLARQDQKAFRASQLEAWESVPFFRDMWARADANVSVQF